LDDFVGAWITLKKQKMKTAVIIGGNSGIGKATATTLAKNGYRVIIHGRDPEKTKQAAEEIIRQSGSKNVESISADVSVLKGMKELADVVKAKTNSIDTLIFSQGVILPKQIITTDGNEMGFAIQYLSRFALTQLLLPLLKQSGNAKIVQVGAPTMKKAEIFFDDLALKNNFSMMRALGQEMLANHLLVEEFAKRNPDNKIVMNIFHVGIAKTGIMRETGFFLRLLVNLFGKSPETASANCVYLASSDDADFSGYFLPKPGKPLSKVKINFDEKVSEKLWNTSMDLIKSIL
jgi:NAD(P)-dependent dehydrogenase (short-subunit alcohol dehydrogenase family)